MNNFQKESLNYVFEIQKMKKIANKVKNKELVFILDKLLFPNNVNKYASFAFAQIVKDKVRKVNDFETEETEILDPEEIEEDSDPSDVFNFNRIGPQVFEQIDDESFKSNSLEQELRNSIEIGPDNKIKVLDEETVKKVFAIMFLKYGEKLANVAVSHFMGLPGSIRSWSVAEEVPDELKSRYSNKLMQETAIQNILRLRGKMHYDPLSRDKPGYPVPSEVSESTIGQEIVDRTMEVLLNNNGIYLGNVHALIGFILTGTNFKDSYNKNIPKDSVENLRNIDIDVSGNGFEEKFVKGLGRLVFIVVAQQFLERWGALSYNQNTGELNYRNIGREIHPSKQLSLDNPGFDNPSLRNIYNFVPTEGKRHDINLQDEQELVLRKIFDINESGQQAFNELYDSRVNKSDQNYLGQHLATDAKMLASKIVENFENLFGKFDLSENQILKPSPIAFKSLFSFYMQIMSWLKEGKGGFQSANTTVVKVPPQMFDYLGVSYNKNKVDKSETVMSDDGETMYQNDYIPIKPFGIDPSSARYFWEQNMNYILGSPGSETDNPETPREIYREIFREINSVGNQEQINSMNRILANELKSGIEAILSRKIGELVERRKKASEIGEEVEAPEWNKRKKGARHDWTEYAAVLYSIINNLEIITEVAPLEIVTDLKNNTETIFQEQLG